MDSLGKPVTIGTETKHGKIGAILSLAGERYYMMVDKRGSVALMPWSVIEPEVKESARP